MLTTFWNFAPIIGDNIEWNTILKCDVKTNPWRIDGSADLPIISERRNTRREQYGTWLEKWNCELKQWMFSNESSSHEEGYWSERWPFPKEYTFSHSQVLESVTSGANLK